MLLLDLSLPEMPDLDVIKQVRKLFLSVETVSTCRTRILEKMGMRSNADITSCAIKHRLMS